MITAEEILNDQKYRAMSKMELYELLHSSKVSYDEFEKISGMKRSEGHGLINNSDWLIDHYYPNNPIKPKCESKKIYDGYVEYMKNRELEALINMVIESIDKTIDPDFEQFKKQTKLAVAELEAKVAKLTYQVELTKYAQVVDEDDRVEFGDVQISNKYGTAVAYVGRFSSGTASEHDNNKCLVAEFGYRFELIKDGDLMGGDIVVIRKIMNDEN
jgi:hypothetical protein